MLDAPTKRRLMTMAEVEAEFGFPINTQRFWRHKRTGPRSFRAGRRVMYDRADIELWINAQRQGGAA